MQLMIKKVIFSLLLLHCTFCHDWESIMSYSASIPSNVFLVSLPLGVRLEVSVRWQSSADLDIYLYNAGANLLSESTY